MKNYGSNQTEVSYHTTHINYYYWYVFKSLTLTTASDIDKSLFFLQMELSLFETPLVEMENIR